MDPIFLQTVRPVHTAFATGAVCGVFGGMFLLVLVQWAVNLVRSWFSRKDRELVVRRLNDAIR